MRLVSLTTFALVAALAVPALAAPAQADASVATGVATSFDGTPIVYTLFLPAGASADHPVPAVLMTHGWAGSRSTSAGGMVGRLLDAGFAVLTWDSRGFGQSGGFIELDSPAYEVRDASALIDLLAANPAIQQDGAGDPRVGMTGGSYAGGIQLLTAAFDPRVDAIVPDITWNDLRQSLGPGGVPKELWVQVLFGAGAATGEALGLVPGNPAGPQAQSYDTNLPLWYAEVHAANGLTPDVAQGLAERSATTWSHIRAPTLLTQGLPDTLFNPNEAVANWKALLGHGTPAELLLYCGGHAGCPYAGPGSRVDDATVAWLSLWLKGEPSGLLWPPVQWEDNTGAWHGSISWPPPGSDSLHASATLKLASTPAPTGGGAFSIGAGGLNGGAASPVSDDGVGSALVPIPGAAGREVSGIGQVHLSVSGLGTEAFLFFRLVDATDGTVLDGQTQAFRLPVSPFSASRADVDLVGVDYVIPAGHELALQVSTSDVAHATNRQPGVYDITLSVDVPLNG